jgi:Mrp family chromosome partitioning ATPase
MNMKQILGILLRRKRLFLIPFAVVFLVPAVYSFYFMRTYESSALVWLDASLDESVRASASGNKTAIQTLADTFEQMLESDAFAAAVISRASLDETISVSDSAEGMGYFRGNVDVEVVGPSAMRITFSGSTPAEALAYVDATTSEFLDWVKGDASREEAAFMAAFAEKSNTYRQDVENARAEVAAYLEEHPDADTSSASTEEQQEYARLQSNVVRAQEVQLAYDSSLSALVKAQALTEAERQQYVERLRTVDKPTEPASFSKRKMLLADIIALMVATIVGGTAVAVAEVADRTLRREHDVKEALDWPMLAEVRRSRGRHAAAIPQELLTDEALAQYDELTARLLLLAETEPFTLAVTSASAGEGVSTVSACLATALAHSTCKDVVLVDANLRSPALHIFLGLPLQPGLRDAVEGKENCQWRPESTELLGALGRSAKPASPSNLWLVPSGEPTQHPARLTTSEGAKLAIQGLRTRFGLVIIDCPPVLSAVDAASLCRLADGVVFVAQAGTTSLEDAKRAQELLAVAPVMGVVLNGT